MLSVLAFIGFFGILAIVVMVAMHIFSPEQRDGRAVRKAERVDATAAKNALTAERERSTLAQNALRQIAAGSELPVFVASDALSEINKTYTKEITK